MEKIAKILLLIEQVAPPAQWLVDTVNRMLKLTGAQLTVVQLISEQGIQQVEKYVLLEATDSRREIVASYKEQLENQLARFTQSADVRAELLIGDAPSECVKMVIRNNIDLVVKPRVDLTRIDQLSQKLFRKCPCPVLVMKPGNDSPGKVVAAVDLSATEEEEQLLNERIVAGGEFLAKLLGAEIHYLNTYNLQLEMLLHGPRFNVTVEELVGVKAKIKEEREKMLKELLHSCGADVAEKSCHIIEGLLEEVIEEIIDREEMGALVMGSLGRSGAPGIIIGNTAEKILTHSDCTIMAVKPDGFVSPITL